MKLVPVEGLSLNEIRSDEFKELQQAAYDNDVAKLQKRFNEFVTVPCPACNDTKSIYRFTKYGCKFLECIFCSTLYMSPRPTPKIMDEYYGESENYEFWAKYIFPKSEAGRREKICRPNLERLIEECKSYSISSPILVEIGPGFGTFSELAKNTGFFNRVVVVERTPSMAASCKAKDLEVIESPLESVTNFLELADVAVCFEVIEHVFDPINFLEGIGKILKIGGLFMFTCPNGKGFDTEMLGVASPSVDTEHVNLFNPMSVEVLLERSGFEVISVETPGRLDLELFRRAVIAKDVSFLDDPFWKSLLFEKFESAGFNFQKFLMENKMSGSMRVIARKVN